MVQAFSSSIRCIQWYVRNRYEIRFVSHLVTFVGIIHLVMDNEFHRSHYGYLENKFKFLQKENKRLTAEVQQNKIEIEYLKQLAKNDDQCCPGRSSSR